MCSPLQDAESNLTTHIAAFSLPQSENCNFETSSFSPANQPWYVLIETEDEYYDHYRVFLMALFF